MGTYKMTAERAKKVLAFRGVPNREAEMIDLLRAAGLQNLNANTQKRGLPLEQCPRPQLYAAAQNMYRLALAYVPKLASDEYQSPRGYLSRDEKVERCSGEWRKNLRTWLNLAPDQAEDYSTADLEAMLCGE